MILFRSVFSLSSTHNDLPAHFLVCHLLTPVLTSFLSYNQQLFIVAMAQPRAKRARFSTRDVIGMLESEFDDAVHSESDSDEDYNDEDEVMCDCSDEEFYDFDKEEVPPQDLDFYPPASLCEDREELPARLHEERVET